MTSRKFFSLLLSVVIFLIVAYGNKDANQSQKKNIQSDTVLSASNSALLGESAVTVTKVIDGDTLEIEGGLKVRYIGIDTPETKHPVKGVQCFGKEAFEKNKELIEGKKIRLEKDVSETDRYGRFLRYVFIDGLFINDYLVRQGYAHASTYPPDVKYADQFRSAEQEARDNNRGLWIGCQE